MSKKGSGFEIVVANMLSEWWCPGRSDIFWRVLGSGSRAKSRGRKGLATYGTAGDITAVDPIGAPFCEVFTTECKKGYPKMSPYDIIDRVRQLTPSKENFDGWVLQVEESSKQAGTPYWLIVFRRPKRNIMVAFPGSLLSNSSPMTYGSVLGIRKTRSGCVRGQIAGKRRNISFMPLSSFLGCISPSGVIEMAKARKCSNP